MEKETQMFKTGYCAEFAVSLLKKFPDLKLGFIGGKYLNEDFDKDFPDEEPEFLYEGCHAVLFVDDKVYMDSEGLIPFNKDAQEFLFSDFNNIIEVELIKLENEDDLEGYFGGLDQNAIDLATEHINKYSNFYNNEYSRYTDKLLENPLNKIIENYEEFLESAPTLEESKEIIKEQQISKVKVKKDR